MRWQKHQCPAAEVVLIPGDAFCPSSVPPSLSIRLHFSNSAQIFCDINPYEICIAQPRIPPAFTLRNMCHSQQFVIPAVLVPTVMARPVRAISHQHGLSSSSSILRRSPARPAIHDFNPLTFRKPWMAGTRPAMTVGQQFVRTERISLRPSPKSEFSHSLGRQAIWNISGDGHSVMIIVYTCTASQRQSCPKMQHHRP